MSNLPLNPERQKSRLRWVLLSFFVLLALPVFYLLQTTYSKLENEAHFTARQQAEILITRFDQRLREILQKEQDRPIAEYRFFNVMENPLLSETTGIKFSPLSEIPPKSDIAGLVGYFQIDTDGTFHLPALPEIGQDNLSGLSLAELQSRLALKKRLQGLLSIELAESGPSPRPQHKKKAPTAKLQSYRDEFQQPSFNAEKKLAPVAKIKQKMSRRLSESRSRAKTEVKKSQADNIYQTRKEIVHIPDQSMASDYLQQSQAKLELSETESLADSAIQEPRPTADSAIDVLSFESEVTPLQLLLIGQEYFCFYRYIWHDSKRYTQGFIVERAKFLHSLTKEIVDSTNFSSLVFVTQGKMIEKIELSKIAEEHALYQRFLATPFEKLELNVYTARLTEHPGSILIDFLALAIFAILLTGFWAFYRLAARQMELARQQQNFISAVSHELKTPLTSIRMYGELLRSGWLTDAGKQQTYYDYIFFESERLSRLINNVLQLARMGRQEQDVELVEIETHSLLTRIADKIAVQIEAANFKLTLLEDDRCHGRIRVDEDAFFQIIINLVDNAIKFSNHGDHKSIDIGCISTDHSGYIVFFIRDYGPGIPRDQIKKIFRLFYRAGNELTRTTPGTGIGLALVAQLAESMQAKIKVINRQPGAEFQIKIPLVD